MKFEAKSLRETTVEHYGKHGIGWHGCALIYYLYQHEQDNNGNIIINDEGNKLMFAKKHVVYIDYILEDGNRQNVTKGVGFGKSIIHSSDHFIDNAKEDTLYGMPKEWTPQNDDMFKSS